MAILIIFIFFFILILIPFIPGIIELLRPKDSLPLHIPMDYSKDPRCFGKSFRNIIGNAITMDADPGIREVTLSKNEKVEVITEFKSISKGEEVNHILYTTGDLVSEDKVRFNKEVYVKGNAAIGSKNTLRAIACDGKLSLLNGVRIVKWADAQEKIEVHENCDLGISISSEDELRIGRGCKFKCLYGIPIITYGIDNNDSHSSFSKKDISGGAFIVNKECMTIPPFTKIESDLIIKKDLIIRMGCIVIGSVKTYGDLIIEKDTKIFGNLFSEKNIEIGENTVISGDIFSQNMITIKNNVTAGSAGKIKSVIGKTGIILNQNIKIYGYVATKKSGMVI